MRGATGFGVLLAALHCGNPTVRAGTQGARVAFKASVADEVREASTELHSVDDVAYVALNAVMHQFGGAASILPGRAQLDFLGRSAWVRLDARNVNASLKQFQLRHDVIQKNGDLLMALSDIAPFFKDAFGVDVTQELGTASQTTERLREPETIVMHDLAFPEAPAEAPVESVAPPDLQTARPQERRGTLRTIVIDAGHGGLDQGSQGVAIAEKDLTLAVARHVARILEASAFDGRVILTRTQDTNPPLEARARLANAQRADVLVSIHAGASMAVSAQGFELFVPPDGRLRAALSSSGGATSAGAERYAGQSTAIAEALGHALRETTGAVHRGIRTAPCRLFYAVDMPGVMVEIGSLTNPTEAARLAEQEYQMKLAQGIADGLLAYAARLSSGGAVR